MGNEKVLKVFHAARQDIEIVWHQRGSFRTRFFDTQVAAMVLGYGDSIAYDQLVSASPAIGPTRPSFHRLVAAAAERGADALRGLRRHPFARGVHGTGCRSQKRDRSDWVSEEWSPDLAKDL
jgi:ribonuclease D